MPGTDWSTWNDGIRDANREVIEEFRAHGGHVGGHFAGAPMLLLHHVGRTTGTEWVNPLMYVQDGHDLVVAASKGGAPEDPGWYRNLLVRPVAHIEVGTTSYDVIATVVTGAERDRLYGRLADIRPAFADYQRRTRRLIPMIRLTPRSVAEPGSNATDVDTKE